MSVTERQWEPSPNDAVNLAALRYYALETERLSILIYASDRAKERPGFLPLARLLAAHVKELREFSRGRLAVSSFDCPGDFDLCDDGLCHPPGDCSS